MLSSIIVLSDLCWLFPDMDPESRKAERFEPLGSFPVTEPWELHKLCQKAFFAFPLTLCPLFPGQKFHLQESWTLNCIPVPLRLQNKVTARWKTLFPFLNFFKGLGPCCVSGTFTCVNLFWLKPNRVGESVPMWHLSGMGKFAQVTQTLNSSTHIWTLVS